MASVLLIPCRRIIGIVKIPNMETDVRIHKIRLIRRQRLLLADDLSGGTGTVGVGRNNESHAVLGSLYLLTSKVEVLNTGDSLSVSQLVDGSRTLYTDGEGIEHNGPAVGRHHFNAVNRDVAGHVGLGGYVEGQQGTTVAADAGDGG